jgi:hypothetical protein
VDVPAKAFLTCVPESPRDALDQAVARGKIRYDRFSKAFSQKKGRRRLLRYRHPATFETT